MYDGTMTVVTQCNDGAKFHENEAESFDAHSATAGDRIGCLLSYSSGSLTFYKNGIKMGVAFTGKRAAPPRPGPCHARHRCCCCRVPEHDARPG